MSNLTIFEQQDNLPAEPIKGMSKLGQSLNVRGGVRRIQTNTNGTFRRIVGGEQTGKPVRGEFEAIIVAMLPNVSRTYYASAYDPSAAPSLPDCWSNDGKEPESSAGNAQSPACATCPQNVTGSGNGGKGRACRYQRRIALLLAGDPSGDVYQFNVPAKSLFGKGDGNVHPFESYVRFLVGNDFSPDRVVTRIAYDLDSDTMALNFSPSRPITAQELALVEQAQSNPATQRLVELTVAQADGVSESAPPAKAPAPKKEAENPWGTDEPEDAEFEAVDEEPKKRPSKAKKPKAAAASADDDPALSSALDSWITGEE